MFPLWGRWPRVAPAAIRQGTRIRSPICDQHHCAHRGCGTARLADGTYSLELDCTLRLNHTLFAAQECQLVAGAVAYFSVQSGPINRVGARYEILVTRL
jgi:hypothetical protein